ncbi:hypothetical protein PA27867_2091 [Cryobacterium arcticum]|uniref:UvrD-like helicase ATP-binding domain-containing protein n=2 Tax=Cryobacterium arcticum TaxID=670052 RepID=A0A1B1BKV5_9MICO|nr:hypothetical protein PA27867_2091 [Cryobacterium arcticum]
MPAGTGKTHLVAALAALADETDDRVLILTHTHAGVGAIRTRLKAFGVASRNVHVDTITGWAFDLVRSYPGIAGIVVPENPDWSSSSEYVAGAMKVVNAQALTDVHAASFEYFIVDEYQDCDLDQHEFVLAIVAAIPKTCVLGDRLQGIFDFSGQVLVDWDAQVFESFPRYPQAHTPRRWAGHNKALGQWLLDIRPALLANEPINLAAVDFPGFSWNLLDPRKLASSAFAKHPDGESVLVLGQWAADANQLASKLNGVYEVMEDIQGNFMVSFLTRLDAAEPANYAALLARFAKQCFSGLGGLDRAITDKLSRGATIGHLSRPGLASVQGALDAVMEAPTYESVTRAMRTIGAVRAIRLFKREAWNEVRKAIDTASSGDVTAVGALSNIRDALRRTGRHPSHRVVSRTLLVKGLEYDHVIIANAGLLTSSRNLYVALSRARKTLTVFSPDSLPRYTS